MAFHDVRFPTAISRGCQGGPERRTDVVVLGSGFEERNSRWANCGRSYNAGYGVKSLERSARHHCVFRRAARALDGFRWKDHERLEILSRRTRRQRARSGDRHRHRRAGGFQLKKTYGSAYAPWARDIKKPVTGTVKVAVAASPKRWARNSRVDPSTGIVTFLAGNIPAIGASVTAGFEFDVPVRFDTDKLEVNVSGFHHGAIPNIPIIEVRL